MDWRQLSLMGFATCQGVLLTIHAALLHHLRVFGTAVVTTTSLLAISIKRATKHVGALTTNMDLISDQVVVNSGHSTPGLVPQATKTRISEPHQVRDFHATFGCHLQDHNCTSSAFRLKLLRSYAYRALYFANSAGETIRVFLACRKGISTGSGLGQGLRPLSIRATSVTVSPSVDATPCYPSSIPFLEANKHDLETLLLGEGPNIWSTA